MCSEAVPGEFVAGIAAAKVDLLRATETLDMAKGVFLGQFGRGSWNESGVGPPPLTAFLTIILVNDNSHSYAHLILALGIV